MTKAEAKQLKTEWNAALVDGRVLVLDAFRMQAFPTRDILVSAMKTAKAGAYPRARVNQSMLSAEASRWLLTLA